MELSRRTFFRLIGTGATVSAVSPTAIFAKATLPTTGASVGIGLTPLLTFKTAMEASYGFVSAARDMHQCGGLIDGAFHTAKVVVGHASNMFCETAQPAERTCLAQLLNQKTRGALISHIKHAVTAMTSQDKRAFAEHHIRMVMMAQGKGLFIPMRFTDFKMTEDPTSLFLQDWTNAIDDYSKKLAGLSNIAEKISQGSCGDTQALTARISAWTDRLICGDFSKLLEDPLFCALQKIHTIVGGSIPYSPQDFMEQLQIAEREGFPRERIFDSEEYYQQFCILKRIDAELTNYELSCRSMQYPEYILHQIELAQMSINNLIKFTHTLPVWAKPIIARFKTILTEHARLQAEVAQLLCSD